MKFNRRVGRDELTGAVDFVQRRHRCRDQDSGRIAQRPRRNRRYRSPRQSPRALRSANWPKTSSAPGLVRVERAVKERLGQAETDNLMPHDLINAKPISAAIKEFFGSSQLSQFMDQTNPAVRDHPQAPRFGAGTGRLDPRTRRLRSARRASDPLWPRVPDRNAGRPEHRPDQLAGAVCAHQRVRFPRDALPQGRRRARSPTRSITCRRSRKAISPSRRPMPNSTSAATSPNDIGVLRATGNEFVLSAPDAVRVHGRLAGAKWSRWPLR